jgi:cysteine synthase
MSKTNAETIEDSVIDATFRGVSAPQEIHRMGREDITENRPGDVLVDAVKRFAAGGGFTRAAEAVRDDGVNVSISSGSRIDLAHAEELVRSASVENKTSETPE